MKVSAYNIFVPQAHFSIAYNSLSDSFCGVSKNIASLIESGDVETISNSAPEVYSSLCDKGFIIEDDIDEFATILDTYFRTKHDDTNLYLMVYPSQDCNLKCWYCYESHKKDTRMSPEVIEKTILYIRSIIKPGYK